MSEAIKSIAKRRTGYKPNEISPQTDFAISAILTLLSLLFILPVVFVVIISFSTAQSIADKGYSFIPSEVTLATYKLLFKTGSQILDSYIITVSRTVIGTILSVSVMTMFAFVVAYKGFPLRKFYTYFLFGSSIFSGGLVASFIINVKYLNLYDSFWIYVLPGLVSWFNVIILRTFISTSIPDELFEVAKIDGAGDFRIFLQIVLPLCKAGIATIALFSVVGHWNEWTTALIYIDDPKLIPVQTLLQKIQQNINYIKNNSDVSTTMEGQEMLRNLPSESAQMAITVIATLPILFVYPFFQKYFIKGLTIGSVKG